MEGVKFTATETRALTDLIKRAVGKEAVGKSFSQLLDNPDQTVFRIQTKGQPDLKLSIKDLNPSTLRDLGKLREASEKMEGALVKQMLEVMQKSLPKDKLDGPMSDFAKDLMNQSISEDMGAKGTLGLGSILFRDMSNQVLRQELATKMQAQLENKK